MLVAAACLIAGIVANSLSYEMRDFAALIPPVIFVFGNAYFISSFAKEDKQNIFITSIILFVLAMFLSIPLLFLLSGIDWYFDTLWLAAIPFTAVMAAIGYGITAWWYEIDRPIYAYLGQCLGICLCYVLPTLVMDGPTMHDYGLPVFLAIYTFVTTGFWSWLLIGRK